MDPFKSIQQMFSPIIILILLIFLLEIKCQNNTQETTQKVGIEVNGTDFKLPGLNKFNKVRLNAKNYERVKNMHANWYGAGIKALMGKMGRDLFVKLSIGKNFGGILEGGINLLEDEQRKLANCLDGIEDKKDLVLAANCLVNARKVYEKRRRRIWNEQNEQKLEGKNRGSWNKNEMIDKKANNIEQNGLKRIKLRKLKNKRMTLENIDDVQRRRKRMIGKGIELIEWSKRLRQFRGKYKFDEKNSRKKELNENSKMQKSKWAIIEREKMRPKFDVRQAEELEKLPSQEDRSAIIRISNLISMFGANKNSTEERMSGAKWTKMYESLVRLKRANEKRKESPGARVYEMRMYDLVLDRKEPSMGPKQKMSPEGLIQMGISLLNKLQNGTDQRESNFKFMSPRFAPLMPDKQDAHKSILSPTIFALYEPGMKEENEPKSPFNVASIPEVLKATGLNKQDRDALLQSLMEVSGSIGHIQEAMELLKALNFFEIEPDLMDANERILNAYTKMERTFDLEQEKEIEREGWTFLRGRQFDELCREQNAEFPEKMRKEIEQFGEMDKEKRELALWKRIERIARNIPDEIGDKLDARKHEKMMRLHLDRKLRRRKRQTNPQQIQWLSVLRPVILEPFMFTPVYGLSVLGPLILSPNIFSPLILAPSVLSPYILSPAAPIPYILSPYVFGPFILSPMALAPFILTPYVLSPNVLNPFALAPLILSPTVLSPDILSPQILGGGILSPTVGSPAVLTESYLMASVLSPSVLSK